MTAAAIFFITLNLLGTFFSIEEKGRNQVKSLNVKGYHVIDLLKSLCLSNRFALFGLIRIAFTE